MNTYTVDFYKNRDLSPDERNAQRTNHAGGIWLCTGFTVQAANGRKAIGLAKADENIPLGVNCGYKLRARRIKA